MELIPALHGHYEQHNYMMIILSFPTLKKLLHVAEELEASKVDIKKLEQEVFKENSLAVGSFTHRVVQDHLELLPPWSRSGIKCSSNLLAILSTGKAEHFRVEEVLFSSESTL